MNDAPPIPDQLYSQAWLKGDWLLVHVAGIEPPGLNGDRGLLRMHFKERGNLANRLQLMLRSALGDIPIPKPKGKVRVTYVRSYLHRPMDEDNLASSAKPVLDALVALGVLEDDSPEHIELKALQAKRKGRGPHFQLRVEPL